MARSDSLFHNAATFSPGTFTVFLFAVLLAFPSVSAQGCISLSRSTACPAFNRSSVSTNAQLQGYFPFLSNVSNVESFDRELNAYVRSGYVTSKYRDTFGCSAINSSNTDSIYARYTISFICNAIVQNSVQACRLSPADSQPLCADSCANFASSEQRIVASPELCGTPRPNVRDLLYADLVNCGLPRDSIGTRCVPGYENEPNNCGFEYNTAGLCGYCARSTVNSTDSCCVTAKAESRCQNVHLPAVSSMQPLVTSSATSSAQPSATGNATAMTVSTNSPSGLSGGAIAGIVIGAVAAAALLLALIVFGCLYLRRKRSGPDGAFLNQPTPPRSGGGPAVTSSRSMDEKFAPVPGARVTRMTALERSSDNSTPKGYDGSPGSNELEPAPPVPPAAAATTAVAVAGLTPGGGSTLGPPSRDKSGWRTPAEGRDPTQPSSPDSFNTADGSPGRSEQLDAFKDYYSEDDIHPGDYVSTLWAYQPRAGDEFTLERGDMLRISGIWDDGWATATRVNMRAEDWNSERNTQRDSGFSTQGANLADSPPTNGPVKAFPLVCVCLPQHWGKIVEDETEDPAEPNPRRP